MNRFAASLVLSIAAIVSGATLIAGRVPVAAAGAQATAPTAEALARSLQKNLNDVISFRATFEQTTSGGPLRLQSKKPAGEGTVLVKKPGRMRWEYTKPEKSLFLSDGSRIYNCYLDAKEASCDDPVAVPRDDEAPTAMLFLAGKSDILRDFKVARVDSPVRDTLALRLDPRKPDPDYEYMVVAFDPKTYEIRGLMTRDRQASESTIVFRNIKVNPDIPDKTFACTAPCRVPTTKKPR